MNILRNVKAAVLVFFARRRERFAEDAAVLMAYAQRDRRRAIEALDREEQRLLDDAHKARDAAVAARQRVHNFIERL